MPLSSFFLGDDDLNNIDTRINSIVSQISSVVGRSSDDNIIPSDFIAELIEKDPKTDIERLLQNVTVSKDRLERYNIYEEAYRYIPIIKRMIRVYIANLLQKNPVTKKSILVREASDISIERKNQVEVIDSMKKFANSVINHFNLNIKLRNLILPKVLIYGDCFVEVVNINDEFAKRKTSDGMALFEATVRSVDSELKQIQYKNGNAKYDSLFKKLSSCLVEVANIITDYDSNSEQNHPVGSLNDILLKIHKPHNIVILHTDYGSVLGYLEVAKDEFNQIYNLTQTLSTLVGKVTSILGRDITSSENITDQLIQNVVKLVLEKTVSSNPDLSDRSIDKILSSLDPEVYNFIKRIVVERGLSEKTQFNKVKVRYIPISRMVHFNILSSEFDPYGGSFIDPLTFNCKLYILSQLANVILKLSRAAPVRKWTIDIGATQMHAGLIQKLKRELYNTRVTLDDISSFKSIPKILSDFKDMFILSKGGARPIDVEVTSHGDPTVRVADLEDARREIMSLSGIPPAYLGYADVIELREQLVHTNVSFATEIVDMQENIAASLTKLVDIVARFMGLEYIPSQYIQVELIPPITLILQLIEMSLSSIGNISGIFQTLQTPVDPYFFLKQYIPYIDWDDFKEKAEQYVQMNQTKSDLGGGGM